MALAASVVFSTSGNVFAKWASVQSGARQKLGLLFAAGVFCIGFVFYALALAGLPLAIAHPVLVGCSVTCVTVIGIIALREKLSVRRLLGVALILCGLFALNYADLSATSGHQEALPAAPESFRVSSAKADAI